MIQRLVDNMAFEIVLADPDCPAAGHMLRGRVELVATHSIDIIKSMHEGQSYEEDIKKQVISSLHAYLYADLTKDLWELRRQMHTIMDGVYPKIQEEACKALDIIKSLQEKIKGI